MKKTKKKGTYTLEKMRPIVAGFAHFQGTKQSYCEQLDLNPHTLDYWRRRIREQASKEGERAETQPTGKFIPLHRPVLPQQDHLILHFPDGRRLQMPLSTPPALLQHLIQIQLSNPLI